MSGYAVEVGFVGRQEDPQVGGEEHGGRCCELVDDFACHAMLDLSEELAVLRFRFFGGPGRWVKQRLTSQEESVCKPVERR